MKDQKPKKRTSLIIFRSSKYHDGSQLVYSEGGEDLYIRIVPANLVPSEALDVADALAHPDERLVNTIPFSGG